MASPVMRGDCLLQSRGFLDVGCIQLHPACHSRLLSGPLAAAMLVVKLVTLAPADPSSACQPETTPLWLLSGEVSARALPTHPSCNRTVNQLGCCSRSRATVIVHSLRFPPHCSILQYSATPPDLPFLGHHRESQVKLPKEVSSRPLNPALVSERYCCVQVPLHKS